MQRFSEVGYSTETCLLLIFYQKKNAERKDRAEDEEGWALSRFYPKLEVRFKHIQQNYYNLSLYFLCYFQRFFLLNNVTCTLNWIFNDFTFYITWSSKFNMKSSETLHAIPIQK